MYCKKCGAEIGDNARYCEKCGEKVSSENSLKKPVKQKKKFRLLNFISLIVLLVVIWKIASNPINKQEKVVTPATEEDIDFFIKQADIAVDTYKKMQDQFAKIAGGLADRTINNATAFEALGEVRDICQDISVKLTGLKIKGADSELESNVHEFTNNLSTAFVSYQMAAEKYRKLLDSNDNRLSKTEEITGLIDDAGALFPKASSSLDKIKKK